MGMRLAPTYPMTMAPFGAAANDMDGMLSSIDNADTTALV